MFPSQQITGLSKEATEKLLYSIDYVFFDIDGGSGRNFISPATNCTGERSFLTSKKGKNVFTGVLVHNRTLIPGAIECIATLRKLGKKIGFVTNNSLYPIENIIDNLKPFEATEDEIVTPNDSLLTHLKKIGFDKDIYVISTSVTKNLLKTAGYNVIEFKDIQSEPIEETLTVVGELSRKALDICKNVGAVLVDYDFNFCIGSAQVAKIILNHMKGVILLGGLTDDTVNISQDMKTIGTKFYIDGIERWSKINATVMGKPGIAVKTVLKARFNITDDSRVLFVGDNVEIDIIFGVKCGFKTYLVLSGVTSESEVEKWKFAEMARPTYVSKSVNDLYKKIQSL